MTHLRVGLARLGRHSFDFKFVSEDKSNSTMQKTWHIKSLINELVFHCHYLDQLVQL